MTWGNKLPLVAVVIGAVLTVGWIALLAWLGLRLLNLA